jgi:hypothetical protein
MTRSAPLVRLTVGFALSLLLWNPAEAQSLQGAWRMVSFEGGGSMGPATGQMLFVDSHWTLLYAMDEKGHPTAGRGHGGTYQTSGDTLTLKVEWSMQNVTGKASVSNRVSENVTQFTITGDELVVRYKSGGVMRFKRARQPG